MFKKIHNVHILHMILQSVSFIGFFSIQSNLVFRKIPTVERISQEKLIHDNNLNTPFIFSLF